MSDADLRLLEREAAMARTPSARLALARALERVDRRDDALEALLASREDAETREELGRFPAWTHAAGNAGAAGFADVRVGALHLTRWSARLTPAERPCVLASPFAIVATTAEGIVALDPEDGRELWRAAVDPGSPPVIAPGLRDRSEVRLSRKSGVLRFDLETGPLTRDGDVLEPFVLPAAGWTVQALDGLLAIVFGGSRVLALALEPSGVREVWRTQAAHLYQATATLVTQDVVIVVGKPHVLVIDRRTGRHREEDLRAHSVHADARGFVAAMSGRVLAFHPQARELWATPDVGAPRALSPDVVLTEHALLDRRTGRVRAELSVGNATVLVLKDSVLVAPHDEPRLRTFSLEGQSLGVFDLTSPAVALAPLGRRLHVLLANGELVVLG